MNRVIMMGRLTKEVEIKYAATSNMPICKFTLAVNKKFKKDGEPDADFINCVAYQKQAEFMQKFLSKGRQIAVEGRIQTRNYDKDGTKVYVTEVIVDSIYFADSKPNNAETNTKGDAWETSEDDGELPF